MVNRIIKHHLLGIGIENGIYYHIDENGFIVDIRDSNIETNNENKKRKQYRGIKFYKVK